MSNEYNKDGNLIIHGKSYYEKLKKQIVKPSVSFQESQNRKLENDEKIQKTDKQKQFCKLVKEYREKQGKTQKQLAFDCGVKADVIQRIECFKLIPENHLVQKLRKVLNIS